MRNLLFCIMVPLFLALLSGCVEDIDRTESPVLTYAEELKPKDNGPVDCATVYCLAVECPEGSERVYNGPNDCCGTCKVVKDNSKGQCNNAKQCENNTDLIRLACVGTWSCVDNSCVYTCDTTDPVSE